MPFREPDPADPNVLVGVELPASPEAMREMAYAFAEEYAALGYGEEQLLRLFRQPAYAGPHQALAGLGEPEIRRIVRECVDVYGRVRFVVRDSDERIVKLRLPARPRKET